MAADEKAQGGGKGGMLGATAGAAGGIGLAEAVGNIAVWAATIPPVIADDVQVVITWVFGIGLAALGGRIGGYHGAWQAAPNSSEDG